MSHSSYVALARLCAIESYSLPTYLQTARPWAPGGQSRAVTVLAHIAADQRRFVRRICERLEALECDLPQGDFPQRFTWLNDLSLEYLWRVLIADQRQNIAAIEHCVAELAADWPSRVIAEEALGAARGHLEALEALGRAGAPAPP